jgi:hypothetical protein
MRRFFRTDSETYETIRADMDSESGFPSAHTESWFAPADKSPRDSGGLCLIAAIPEISERFLAVPVEEITEEQYSSAISLKQ